MDVKLLVGIIAAAAAIAAAILSWAAQSEAARQSSRASRFAAKLSATALTFNNDKTVLVGSVTAERAKWRSDLRSTTAKLVGLLEVGVSRDRREEAFLLLSEITLRLNPKGRSCSSTERNQHPLDERIYQAVEEIRRSLRMRSAIGPGSIAKLEQAVGLLVKQEWQVSKDEAVTGRLKQASSAESQATSA